MKLFSISLWKFSSADAHRAGVVACAQNSLLYDTNRRQYFRSRIYSSTYY